jgi:DNA-binding HxlR family transcriptional regulator
MPWPKSTKSIRFGQGNLYSSDCPTRHILDDVTSRWASLVLVLLLKAKAYRFSELAYLIGGVSEKMLAQTLRALEEDGFLLRTVHTTKPPKVEYSLTPSGRQIAKRMQALTSYIEANVASVLAHRTLANRTQPHRAQPAKQRKPSLRS